MFSRCLIVAGIAIACLAVAVWFNLTALMAWLPPLLGRDIANLDAATRSASKAIPLILALGIGVALLGLLRGYLGRVKSVAQVGSPVVVSRLDLLCLLPALLLILLSAPALNQSLAYDEAWTMKYVRGGWLQLLAPDEGNNHLFSSFLIKISVTLLGEAEWAIRLPALLFGVLTVVGIYWLVRVAGNTTPIALLASLLAATSYGFIFCSISARGYSIVMAAAVWVGVALIRENEKAYVALVVVAILTLPTAALIPVAFVGALAFETIFKQGDSQRAIRAIDLTLFAGAIALPFYLWSLPLRLTYMASREARLDGIFAVKLFSYWAGWRGSLVGGLLVLLLAGVGWYGLRKRPVAIYVLILALAALLSHLKGGYSGFWYSAMGMVFVPALLALTRGPALALAILLLAGNAVSTVSLWSPRAHTKQIVALIAAQNYRVATIRATPPMRYYLERRGIYYDNFRSYEDFAKTNALYDIILAYRLSEQDVFAGKTVTQVAGWGDAYAVISDSAVICLLRQ